MHEFEQTTTNPIGALKFRAAGTGSVVRRPSPDVAAKQDSEHSEADFMRDLEKATRRKPKSS